jgi:flagellar capping protein FliD
VSSSIFAGNSRYASDFRSVIDRAVAFASLPKSLLENQKNGLMARSAAVTAVNSKIVSLRQALAAVETSTGLDSYTTDVSASNIRATLSSGVREGTFTIAVSDPGAYSLSMSRDTLEGVSDPVIQDVDDPTQQNIISATDYSLVVNGEEIAIPANVASLDDLAAQINAQAGGKVHAYIVNVAGGGETARYHLSIQSNSYDADDIALIAKQVQMADGSKADLQLLEATRGSTVKYTINGRAAESRSRSIEVAPGVRLAISAANDESDPETVVRVSRSGDMVKAALSSAIAAFNSAIDELDKHSGATATALTGSAVLQTVNAALRGFGAYRGDVTGSDTLAILGIEFTDDGKLQLDEKLYDKATQDGIAPVLDFLGAAGTGGFLKHAADALDMLTNEDGGAVASEISVLTAGVVSQDKRIAEQQERIDRLTADLEARMAKADALIASMEQQVTYITNMFESMRAASETWG